LRKWKYRDPKRFYPAPEVQYELTELERELDAEFRAIIPMEKSVIERLPVRYQKCRYLGKGIFQFSDFDGKFTTESPAQ
jgi:hypothetical protein